MGVNVQAGVQSEDLGVSSFVHAVFSTISAHCEPQGWGSRFPRLMDELYQGHLPSHHVTEAITELQAAKATLQSLPPASVVWDIEDPKARPPWGSDIAPTITNLANYFVSSSGEDVFAILERMLHHAQDMKLDVSLE